MQNSNRLRFEILDESNQNWIYDLYHRPENIEFLEGINAKQDIQLSIQCSAAYNIGAYLIFENDSDLFVGVGGIQKQEPMNDGSFAMKDYDIEFIIVINPEFKGKGYASEFCDSFFNKLFFQHPQIKVPARVSPKNHSCIKLLKKFGFIEVGEVPYHKASNKFSLLIKK